MRRICLFQCWSTCLKCQVLPKQPCQIMILFSILWIARHQTTTRTLYLHLWPTVSRLIIFQHRNASALREVISDLEWASCVTLHRFPRRLREMFVIRYNKITAGTIGPTVQLNGDHWFSLRRSMVSKITILANLSWIMFIPLFFNSSIRHNVYEMSETLKNGFQQHSKTQGDIFTSLFLSN